MRLRKPNSRSVKALLLWQLVAQVQEAGVELRQT
jgi:hypothetical protein